MTSKSRKYLNISEIFFSIQGESTYAGLPFIFIRLSGCNLRCSYCDTKYAYEDGQRLAIDTALKTIRDYDSKYVEITGGEPLLQKNSLHLMDVLVSEGYNVLIETNGSVDISRVNGKVVRIVDIKCPDSGEEKNFDFNNIRHLKKRDEVKFVLSSKKDYDYAKKVIDEYSLDKKCGIIMSGVYKKMPPKKLAGWILKDGLNVRLQVQLHKIVFGDKKGV